MNKKGHPPAAWGKSVTVRVPVMVKDQVLALVKVFKESYRLPDK